MSTEILTHVELLPIEVTAESLTQFLESELKKAIPLSRILPALESRMGTIGDTLSQMAGKQGDDLDRDYIHTKRSLVEILIWLECLVRARNKVLSGKELSENEEEALVKIRKDLQALMDRLDSWTKEVLQARERAARDLKKIFGAAIDVMERETRQRADDLFSGDPLGEERGAQAQKIFSQFFNTLRSSSGTILAFVEPNLSLWNTRVLETGRGLWIPKQDPLPCSLLFSLKGQCHFLFENVGHLLGVGTSKLVIRSISIPGGNIEALICPLPKTLEMKDPAEPSPGKIRHFADLWIETELLMQLKNTRGIIDLKERMVFEVNSEKTLFLVEDYYWDGTVRDYLDDPARYGIKPQELSEKVLKEILTDLLMGLCAMHQKEILHHDIKPNNILLDLKRESSKAVLADFQLATHLADTERIQRLPFVPECIPPEFAKIHCDSGYREATLAKAWLKATTKKLDVWDLGLVMYRLIAHEYPFWIDSLKKKEPEEEIALCFLIAGLKKGWLPQTLKTSSWYPLLEKMLEPDPDQRCSAEEALKMLEAVQI